MAHSSEPRRTPLAGRPTPAAPPGQPPESHAGRLFRYSGRALLRHCPNCGGRHIFATYFRLRPHCPHCGLRLERGERDYFIGAYTLNLVAAELIFAVVFVAVLAAMWPNVNWDTLEYWLAGGAILAPVLFYPFSKTLWLAADLAFRPVTAEDIHRQG